MQSDAPSNTWADGISWIKDDEWSEQSIISLFKEAEDIIRAASRTCDFTEVEDGFIFLKNQQTMLTYLWERSERAKRWISDYLYSTAFKYAIYAIRKGNSKKTIENVALAMKTGRSTAALTELTRQREYYYGGPKTAEIDDFIEGSCTYSAKVVAMLSSWTRDGDYKEDSKPSQYQENPELERFKSLTCAWDEDMKDIQDFRYVDGIAFRRSGPTTATIAAVRYMDRMFSVHRNSEEYLDLAKTLVDLGYIFRDEGVGNVRGFRSATKGCSGIQDPSLSLLTPAGYEKSAIMYVPSGGHSIPNEAKTWQVASILAERDVLKIKTADGHTRTCLLLVSDRLLQFLARSERICLIDRKFIFDMPVSEYVEEPSMYDMMRLLDGLLFDPDLPSDDLLPLVPGAQTLMTALVVSFNKWSGLEKCDSQICATKLWDLAELVRQARIRSLDQDEIRQLAVFDLGVISRAWKFEPPPDSWVALMYISAVSGLTRKRNKIVDAGGYDGAWHVDLYDFVSRRSVYLKWPRDNISRSLEVLRQKSHLNVEKKDRKLIDGRHDAIVVRSGWPLDVLVLAVTAVTLAILPVFWSGDLSPGERISVAIQNMGTGVAPILAIYIISRYQRWALFDMVRGQRACESLEMASKASGVTKEQLAEELAEIDMAKQTLSTGGASVPLRGSEGAGAVTAGRGLRSENIGSLGGTYLRDATGKLYLVFGGKYMKLEQRNNGTYRAEDTAMNEPLYYEDPLNSKIIA